MQDKTTKLLKYTAIFVIGVTIVLGFLSFTLTDSTQSGTQYEEYSKPNNMF